MDAREMQWMVGYQVDILHLYEPSVLGPFGLTVLGGSMLVIAVVGRKEGVFVVGINGTTELIDEATEITVRLGSRTSYFIKLLKGSQVCVMHRFEGDVRFNENFGTKWAEAVAYRDYMNEEEQRRLESARAHN